MAEVDNITRFFRFVRVHKSGCWDWIGGADKHGYGRFHVDDKTHLAHKWLFEFHNGGVPKGLELDHLCRNPACVNVEARVRKPPKGELWVHIDRLDNEDGRVWAIQWWEGRKARYETAQSVVIQTPCFTNFFGTKARQPRAVIVVQRGLFEAVDGVAKVTQLTDASGGAILPSRKRKGR